MDETRLIEKVTIGREDLEKRTGKKILTLKPGLNLLIGPNGSGKSSFLKVIDDKVKHKGGHGDAKKTEITCPTQAEVFFYDSEHTPRNASQFKARATGTQMMQQMALRFMSHGQATLAAFDSILGKPNRPPSIFMFDEPENGLDLDGITKFVGLIKKAVEDDHQVIMATHHPILWMIEGANVVPFGEGKKYMEDSLARFREILRMMYA